jgi:hypothetical protein
MVAHICDPSYVGSINRKFMFPKSPGKIIKGKRAGGMAPSSRAPARQVHGPELKPQYCQKKKKFV